MWSRKDSSARIATARWLARRCTPSGGSTCVPGAGCVRAGQRREVAAGAGVLGRPCALLSLAAVLGAPTSAPCMVAAFFLTLPRARVCFRSSGLIVLQALKAGDLVTWDPNGNGYYVTPHNKWYVEAGKYDERGAGGGLGQWDRDHHFDVWGKVNHTLCWPVLPLFRRLTIRSPLQPFLYGRHGIQCQHPGCDFESGAGDV